MVPRTLNFDSDPEFLINSVETLEKRLNAGVYDVAVTFSAKVQRAAEHKRISSFIPNDQHCDGRYKLKLSKSRQPNKVNIDLMYVNAKCTTPAQRHKCEINFNMTSRNKTMNKNLNLDLQCHTWRHITSVNAKLSDEFKFNIKFRSTVTPATLTFESLEEEMIKDFTIQGSNGYSKKVHKSVLMYSSAVFRRLLKRSNKNCISLKADAVTLAEFIDYMYFGKQPQSNLTQVLKLAREFEMKDLANRCISELFDTVNIYNALNMLNFAIANDCPSLVFGIVYFIKLHSEEIVNENVRTMSAGRSSSNTMLDSFINDYVDSASDILAIKRELFPDDV